MMDRAMDSMQATGPAAAAQAMPEMPGVPGMPEMPEAAAFGPDAPGYGLVLAGGGMRGGYQIGVWQALREHGIPITGVVGTSIGAINAATIAMNDFDSAFRLWLNLTLDDIFEVTEPLPVPENLLAWRNAPAITRMLRQERGLSIEPLRRLLNENIDERFLRRRGFPFGLLTYSLTEHRPLALFIDDIPDSQLINYVMGSCALPYFKSMRVDGHRLIDGGVYNNRPTEMLVNRGWRRIIEVDIHGVGRVKRVNDPSLDLIHVEPENNLFGPFNFQPDACRERIRMGHDDMVAALRRHGLIASDAGRSDGGDASRSAGSSLASDAGRLGDRDGIGNAAAQASSQTSSRASSQASSADTAGSDSIRTGAGPDRS